ncbi:hypothetical protein LTR86_010386 [Recurvomyces mirabilis]|nr:hypothetical protein LTR86_010386 [Recurvomyces mirabilis]
MELPSISPAHDLHSVEQWINNNHFSPLQSLEQPSPTFPYVPGDQPSQDEQVDWSNVFGTSAELFEDTDWLKNIDWSASTLDQIQEQQQGVVITDLDPLQQNIQQLTETLADMKQSMSVIQRDHDAMKRWSVDVSGTYNDMQLKWAGLSPLQKHFGLVLGPKY